MKILLIQPKMNKRPMDTNLKTQMSPSLALLTLMSLTSSEHDVTIVNENIEAVNYNCEVDLVGITITLDVLPQAIRISKRFQRKGILVVAGGIHVTCASEQCLPFFDAICIGPAERVWASILKDAKQGSLKKEYRDTDGFLGKEIVSPAYEHVDSKNYLYTNVVITSRGCPHRCSFCYNSAKNRMYIQRPISDVIHDIKRLGTRHILFIDDNFIGNPQYTRKLLSEIKDMNLIWSAAVTTKILDELDLLDQMAETGCQSLFIGFESINMRSLKKVNKHNIVGRYQALVEAVHSRGIMINASMVFGLDGDDFETFDRTLRWLVKMRIETLTAHILTPYPGTELYQTMNEAGRIFDYDLSKYNTSNVVFTPMGMTVEELYQGYLWIYKEFYSFRNMIRRFPKYKKQRTAYVLFNLFYRKFGAVTSAVSHIIPMGVLGKLATKIAYLIR